MAKERATTKHPGVRYREHSTREHGVKKDRYFSIYYRKDGKKIEEGVGWASKGMTELKAANILGKLNEAKRLGEGPQTLREQREINRAARDADAVRKAIEKKEAVTVDHVFTSDYLPQAKVDKKPKTCTREECLWKLWIKPVIGSMPFKEVSPVDLEKIKINMTNANRTARSITYALAVTRQVFNYAKRYGIYDGDNPVSKVKKPSTDNRRLRYLNHEEAFLLMDALKAKSIDVYNISLLSLHTGMRAGEVFSLTWGDVDLDRGYLTLRDTKNPKKNRIAFLTGTAKEMFKSLIRGEHKDLVFPGKKGVLRNDISRTFERVVNALDFNSGVTDRRQKVVFHTLRHTYASWLVQRGVDLYTVQKLMGHSSSALTERYSHLSEKNLTDAVMNFEQGMVESSR